MKIIRSFLLLALSGCLVNNSLSAQCQNWSGLYADAKSFEENNFLDKVCDDDASSRMYFLFGTWRLVSNDSLRKYDWRKYRYFRLEGTEYRSYTGKGLFTPWGDLLIEERKEVCIYSKRFRFIAMKLFKMYYFSSGIDSEVYRLRKRNLAKVYNNPELSKELSNLKSLRERDKDGFLITRLIKKHR